MKRKRRLLAIAASCMLLLSGCQKPLDIAKDAAANIQARLSSVDSEASAEAETQQQEYASLPLKMFKPTGKSEHISLYAYLAGDCTDVNGNVYENDSVIAPECASDGTADDETNGSVTYDLRGLFRSFDAVLYRTYSSLSASEENWNCSTTVKIYGDDELLYEGPQITADTNTSYDIHLDITGVHELRIVLLGMVLTENYYRPIMALANAAVQQ